MPDIDARRKPRFVLRLTDQVYGQLQQMAQDTGRSMSELATESVEVSVGEGPTGVWRGQRALT